MREYMGELVLVTAPASEPVDRDTEVKLHLRVDGTAEDAYLTRLIKGARAEFEKLNGRALFTSTYRLVLDAWPGDDRIVLPRPPLQSVTSVVYTDEEGNTATLSSDDYYVVTDATPGYLALNAGASWPWTTLRPRAGVAVTFVAGFDDVADIPEEYRQAILLLLAHWYENREAVISSGAVPKSLPFAFESIAMMDRVY